MNLAIFGADARICLIPHVYIFSTTFLPIQQKGDVMQTPRILLLPVIKLSFHFSFFDSLYLPMKYFAYSIARF
jgi:hypothetical protein